MNTDFIKKIFRFNLGLAFVEGILVFWQYVQTPSESAAAIFLGFSPLRLAILLGVIVILGLTGYLLLSAARPLWWDQRPGKIVIGLFERTALFWFFVSVVTFLYVFMFSSEHYLGRLALYRASLSPILIWVTLVALQGLMSFLYSRSYKLPVLQKFQDVLFPASVALVLLALLTLFITLTRIGITPDAVYWQTAGTPILMLQVTIAWLIGLLFHYFISHMDVFHSAKTDLLVAPGLWILACIVWLSQPLTPAYNALEPKAPNFQIYPFGDALLYDVVAHGFLIGRPIPSDFWVKPLYSLFLSFLHVFAKDDFDILVSIQVLILAAIPVLVYLLVSELGSRSAGIVAAVLVILRERNSIALSNVIEVSHSKLLMSDVFTMGLMILILWLLVRWVKHAGISKSLPFMIGGTIALLTLTRGHPIVLLPVIGCIFLFTLRRSPLLWRSLLLLVLGFVIPMISWFWRNYELMGKLAFQNPISAYSAQVAGLYSMTPSLVASPEVLRETDSDNYERLQKQVFEFVLEHPDELLKFVSAHYAHNMIFSYIYLPHTFEIDSLRTYVKTQEFWGRWKGSLGSHGWVLLFLNMGVIALGIGSSWHKNKRVALVPLFIGMGYNLSVSVGRLSGWRFILPADWITLIYYSIGLMQLLYIADYLLVQKIRVSQEPEPELQTTRRDSVLIPVIGFAVFLLAVSTLLTYGHRLFTQPAPDQPKEQLLQVFVNDPDPTWTAWSASDLEKFLGEDNAVVVDGQALYPAFFKANTGMLNYYWMSFETRPYDRIVFYLLGTPSSGVIIATESRPDTFPDGADVIVLGCRNEAGDIEALSVAITSTDTPIVYNREPMPPLTCPLAEPE